MRNRRNPAKPPLHYPTPSHRQVGVDRALSSLAVGAQEGLLPARNIAGVAIQQHARQTSVSSTAQGDGKWRGLGLSTIALSLAGDCKQHKAKGATADLR